MTVLPDQQFIGFSQAQATRIANAVKAIENQQSTSLGITLPTPRTSTMPIMIGKITTAVDFDSTLSPSATKGAFQPYGFSGSNSPFIDSDTAAATADSPIDCWGWNIGDKQTITVGTQCIFVYTGGRWYAVPCQVPRVIRGTLSASLSTGSTVNCTASYCNTGSVPSGTISIQDIDNQFSGASGAWYKATEVIPAQSGVSWWFDWVACVGGS